MASLGDLIVKIGGDTSGFDKSINETKQSIGGLGSSLKSGLAIGAGIAIFDKISEGFTSAISAGWQFNSTMEQNLASFQTMLGGSKQKADEMILSLQKMASTTPFETADLTKGATTLMAFGVEANKVESTLKMLGDVSQGNKDKFSSLTLAFGQVQSAGKLTGEELNQMIGVGFNPLKVMSEQTGKSMATLKDEMSKGAISSQMVTEAFKTATSQGGMFYKSMESQSKTFSGQMSTLSDAVSTTFGTIMKPLFEWVSTIGLPKIISLTETVQKLFTSKGTNSFFDEIKKEIEFLNPVIEGIKTAFNNVKAFLIPWINTFTNSINKMLSDLKPTWETIKQTFISLIPAFQQIWKIIQPIIDAFISVLKFLYNVAYGVINGIILALNPMIKAFTFSFATMTNIITAIISLFKGDFSGAIHFLEQAFKNGIEGIKNVFLALYNFFDGLTVGMITKMINFGKEIVMGLWKGINNNIAWLKSKITEFTNNISNQIKEFFGIASPSKLMAGYGENISEGLAIGIKNKTNDAKKSAQRLSESVKEEFEKMKTTAIDNANKMNDMIIGALKKQYAQKEKIATDSLNKDIERHNILTKQAIDRYEKEYNLSVGQLDDETREKVKSLKKQIDNINSKTEQEEKQLKQQAYATKIAEYQKAIAVETNEQQKAKIKQDLADYQAEYARQIQLEMRNDLINSLNAEIEKIQENAEIKKKELEKEFNNKKIHEENMLKVKLNNIDEEMKSIKTHYENLNAEENVQAVARKMLLDKNNKELIQLLGNYAPNWKDAGKTFGEKLLEGLNEKKKDIQQAVNDLLSMVGRVNTSFAGQSVVGPSYYNSFNPPTNSLSMPKTIGSTAGSINVNVQLDGKTIAKATAPAMVKELKLQGVT